jgi:DNA gyrase/topoisomerase IV subunit A
MKIKSSEYVLAQRRAYAMYVMRNRSLPFICDGLRSASRRILWVLKDGHKYKSAAVGGNTLCIHPHDTPEDTIDGMAAPYGNNIPLLEGHGSFGTLLEPRAFGASRYTSIKISEFSKDVVLCDMDIIPMVYNYDDTLLEPLHFLPLIPIVLLNRTEGIGVGYATNILPRMLDDIIGAQLCYLKKKPITPKLTPTFHPLDNAACNCKVMDNGNVAYTFKGAFERVSPNVIRITKLPYGQRHTVVISNINRMIVDGQIISKLDNSKDVIDITVKFAPNVLVDWTDDKICTELKLVVREVENLNVLDFSGQYVIKPSSADIITQFTDWRVDWYIKRFEFLRDKLLIDIERMHSIIKAADNNITTKMKKFVDKNQLSEFLVSIGVVSVDYISTLPMFRFTHHEVEKTRLALTEAMDKLATYEVYITSHDARVELYITELTQILSNYKKGKYNKKE